MTSPVPHSLSDLNCENENQFVNSKVCRRVSSKLQINTSTREITARTGTRTTRKTRHINEKREKRKSKVQLLVVFSVTYCNLAYYAVPYCNVMYCNILYHTALH